VGCPFPFISTSMTALSKQRTPRMATGMMSL